MKTIKVFGKIHSDEKETILVYDNADKKWCMDSTVIKHYNKAKKQNWEQIVEYVYEDGTVCGGRFIAPDRAVTIRGVDKKQMSDTQLNNLFGDEEL